ncbi:phage tail tube protein [Streptococcus sp. S784/96/1]|uniref:phage tail tube protein n=1 Tax=Streptococcus sp. S784/96/1 TaxID=2653499 RepID=UPI00138A3D4F|nr:phage tail protein [Streptococcus sp. S784/96/1]
MANSEYVSSAKPNVGGAISSALAGTALPVDATTNLDKGFKNLGYISEDGVTNEDKRESEDLLAWGGDVVDTPQTSKSDTFKYKMIEALNIDVLKEVYGPENVTGDLTTGIAIKSNSKELPVHPIVIETLLKNALKRIVIPHGKVKEVGEITYVDGEVLGYEVTIQAYPDTNQNTHYEYIKTVTEGVL